MMGVAAMPCMYIAAAVIPRLLSPLPPLSTLSQPCLALAPPAAQPVYRANMQLSMPNHGVAGSDINSKFNMEDSYSGGYRFRVRGYDEPRFQNPLLHCPQS